jgi:nucleotide-binding universal stress UspA family protein
MDGSPGESAGHHGWRAPCGAGILSAEFEESRVTGWVICGIEDSRAARDTLSVARALGRRLDERVLAVHVAQVPVVLGANQVPGGREDLRDLALEEAQEVLDRVVDESGSYGVERCIEFGEPARALIALADSLDATLIVVGSRRRSALSAALLGSVSLRLCGDAPCPVMIVPPESAARVAHPADTARTAT